MDGLSCDPAVWASEKEAPACCLHWGSQGHRVPGFRGRGISRGSSASKPQPLDWQATRTFTRLQSWEMLTKTRPPADVSVRDARLWNSHTHEINCLLILFF